MQHVLIVTAKYPPARCGVGDYSAMLAQGLVAKGYRVTVLTSKGQLSDEIKGITILPEIESWSTLKSGTIAMAIEKIAPDQIIIQWVPHQYSLRGLSLGLPIAAGLLAKRGHTIHTMLHELWVEPRSLKLFIAAQFK